MQRFQRPTINVVPHLILRSAQDDIDLCFPSSLSDLKGTDCAFPLKTSCHMTGRLCREARPMRLRDERVKITRRIS